MARRRPTGQSDPRKLSWADEQPEPHLGLEVDTRDAAQRAGGSASSMSRQSSAASSSTAQEGRVAYPLTYIVTDQEARAVQTALARIGVVNAPGPMSAPSTSPPTPTPSSYPSTPGGGLPPRSPFIPLSAIKSGLATNGKAAARQRQDEGQSRRSSLYGPAAASGAVETFVVPPQPSIRRALRTAFEDDVLPASSRAALRALAAGYSIYSVLNAILPALVRRKSATDMWKSMFSGAAARTAAAFGLFNFLYRIYSYILTFVRLKILASCSEEDQKAKTIASRALSRLARSVRGNGVVPFFSVVLASPLLLLLPSQTPTKVGAASFPRKTFALDFLVKGLHAHYDVLHRRRSGLVTWIPSWCDVALLYAIGQGQLLWAFLFESDCFPKSYGDFILARSSAYVPQRPAGLPRSVKWPSNRQIADHVALLSTPNASSKPFPSFISPVLSALTPSEHPTTQFATINPVLDWGPAHPAHTRLLCAMLHPNEPSCKTNYLNFWAQEWKQTAKIVALFTAVFNVFRWRAWKKDPEGSLFRFVLSVAQGATVISGNIATAWGLTCLFQHYLPPSFLPRIRYFFNGFLSSVFIFAVPAARRAQLGLYVARLSMDSTWQILVKRRKVRTTRHGDVALLALGLAMLAALYEDMPYTLSGYIRRLLRIALGPRLAGTASSTAGLPEASEASSAAGNGAASADFAAQLDKRIRSSAAPSMARMTSR